MALIVVLAIIAFLVFFVVSMYNSLIRLRNQVKNAWSQIDVQLKRRHDLIPNLLEAVKGYMVHERETLQNITNARTQAMSATTVEDKSKAELKLTDAMTKFNLVVENYPDLKANQNFLSLQEELSSTENKIYHFHVRIITIKYSTIIIKSKCFRQIFLPKCSTSLKKHSLN